jgi:hypothetical protein
MHTWLFVALYALVVTQLNHSLALLEDLAGFGLTAISEMGVYGVRINIYPRNWRLEDTVPQQAPLP